MSDEDEMSYARHDRLEGLLQRGRGLGAVRALQDPAAAAPFVYDGIRRDWRWDGIDERSLYLARLVRDLELSPTPVVEQLAGDEDACLRAVRVLELLALSGSAEARDGLRAHVREGEHWADVLESVADRWPADWWEDLGEVARARTGREAQPPWPREPWIRFGIGTRDVPARPRRGLDGHSDEELLSLLADTRGSDRAKADALRELAGRPATEELIPLVPSLGASAGGRPLAPLRRAVERLGARAVPAARGWAADDREWLAELGVDVLADHGEAEALPSLLRRLADQWEVRAWCGPDPTARRLARFGSAAASAAPVLRLYWLRNPHSSERPGYLEALAAIDPSGLDHAHTESLWDCEQTARTLGIAHAPDLPEVRERLAALREDPMEEPEVRAAAAERSAQLAETA
ncbi:hypothetical protein Snoj_80270 [Streptomyces nojiriensis]|uniref:HEAT repeat domain-containing protein n=1 Tax=Streptomyces nojiriensis TaxID=66374 RepID=A0ABQ3T142_9ACTN|nr:hypothetical protein [Streptomyces nojiriensis]QTI47609.1 hypothetical protein JYK04_05458 [Streptomyces nojiriensis]GGR76809.1 hypothetical protein GCM10010205_02040 [Streptomyces nojiriensis]GHI74109.1 hypothetical protein Snoj_80270 [Streptomyces nojiriensis]